MELVYVLCVVSALQCAAVMVLLRKRRGPDPELSRIETRLARFGEALSLLTETTQSGFASVAAEVERAGTKRSATTGRASASKRIVTAVRKGRSVQDVAADEEVSVSEIRLHLGLAEDARHQNLGA